MRAGRRPAHTRDDFVLEALAIAAEHGLASLSLRTLAAARGVTVATVYRYFADKDDLLAAMWQWVLASLATDEAQGDPGEQLYDLALAYRERVRQYPSVIELSVIPATEGTFSDIARYVIQQLRGLGITGSSLTTAYRQYESFVVGTCLFDFAGAPHHLSTRLQRMSFLDDADFNAQLRRPQDIADDNQKAFEASLRMLISEFSARSRNE